MKPFLHYGLQRTQLGAPTCFADTLCFPSARPLAEEQPRKRYSGCGEDLGSIELKQQGNINICSFPLKIFLQKTLQLSGMFLHNSKS